MTRPSHALAVALLLGFSFASPSLAADFDGAGNASYSVRAGDDLRNVLSNWTRAAGWTLVWNSSYDFQIAGNASFQRNFVDAAGELLTAMQEARPSPVGDIYRANCVIVISDGLSANR
jgi:hypothetical protein